MIKPISISLSPNTEKDDIRLAFKLIFRPRFWKSDKELVIPESLSTLLLEKKFKEYFKVKYAISFNSGRSALLAILKNLNLKQGDEILLQAFTCNAVVNPILWSGLKPVFVDCNEKTFNIDKEDLERKISPKSRAIIVQHTFGLPADMDAILEICKKHNLILIEDCAHALGAEYQNQKVGTFGKIAFFSFSRDKVISSVYGGMVITNDDALAQKLNEFQEETGYPSGFWIFQQLLHPLLMNWFVLPTYKMFGKYLLIFFQWSHILSKAVHWKEKVGQKPNYFPKRFPNALAILALKQFKKLDEFENHRKMIANVYYEGLSGINSFELPPNPEGRKQNFLRFVVKHAKAHEITERARRKNILIGDWYDSVIAPSDTRLDKMGYVLGRCPKAEKLARITFNLPTHINISKEEAQKIIEFLKKWK